MHTAAAFAKYMQSDMKLNKSWTHITIVTSFVRSVTSLRVALHYVVDVSRTILEKFPRLVEDDECNLAVA